MASSHPAVPAVRFGVAVGDLTKLSRDFRSASSKLQQGFKQALVSATGPVLARAKSNASFSPRIAESLRIGSTGGQAKVRVYVRAGGAKAPEAAALEGASGATFKHPVFGNRNVWASQPARPYLFPALTSQADQVAAGVGTAIDRFLHEVGL